MYLCENFSFGQIENGGKGGMRAVPFFSHVQQLSDCDFNLEDGPHGILANVHWTLLFFFTYLLNSLILVIELP